MTKKDLYELFLSMGLNSKDVCEFLQFVASKSESPEQLNIFVLSSLVGRDEQEILKDLLTFAKSKASLTTPFK